MVRNENIVTKRENMRGGEGTIVLSSMLAEEEFCPNMRFLSTLHIPVGGSIGTHTHEKEAELYRVLFGKALYNDNGTEVELEAGDTAICYDGQVHGIKNIGDTELVVLAVIIMV